MNVLIRVPEEQVKRIEYRDVRALTFLILNTAEFHPAGTSRRLSQLEEEKP